MEKDHYIGLIILLGIISVAAFGGFKNSGLNNTLESSQPQTVEDKLSDAQKQADAIQQQITDQKKSPYYGLLRIQYVNHSDTANYEYIVLHMRDDATTTTTITGWKLQSLSSGNRVDIPKGTELFWMGQINSQDPIIARPGDTIYLISGVSPIGYNFKINKCSGYMSQFQTFTPYISTNCPAPRNEDLSSIPKIVGNNACLDYINSMPSCRRQTDTLPTNWSYECTNFILNKINYSACVNTHKNDGDFYQKDWRIYLGRSSTMWQSEREDIVLYDSDGKIVGELTY
jgi:hypothetical protein